VLTAFWEAAGGKLADRFAAVSVPALVFWLGGLAAWTVHQGSLAAVTRHLGWLDRQGAAVQVAVLLTVLLAVAGSGIVVGALATPVLRLLEGYWPRWADPLRLRLARRLAERAAAEQDDWQQAYERVKPSADPTAEDLAVYARLERRRRRRPSSAAYFLPTPIGNILRAAERRPFDKYGLDAVALWPRLWPALPETMRSDLLAARTSLDRAAIAGVWGVLFCAFAPLTFWAIPVGLGVAAAAVAVVVPDRAQAFGELMEAAYDQYRTSLYIQLRWPLPANPHQERAEGQRLTSYLWRGSDDTSPAFTPPADAAPGNRGQAGSRQDLPSRRRGHALGAEALTSPATRSRRISGRFTRSSGWRPARRRWSGLSTCACSEHGALPTAPCALRRTRINPMQLGVPERSRQLSAGRGCSGVRLAIIRGRRDQFSPRYQISQSPFGDSGSGLGEKRAG